MKLALGSWNIMYPVGKEPELVKRVAELSQIPSWLDQVMGQDAEYAQNAQTNNEGVLGASGKCPGPQDLQSPLPDFQQHSKGGWGH